MKDNKEFYVEDLYVARIMEVLDFNPETTELNFVKYAIFKKTDEIDKFEQCVTGEVYQALDASTLKVGQVGVYYQTMKSFYEQFQKSFEQNPDLKNRPLTISDLKELEQKLTLSYINNNILHANIEPKKD